MDDLVSLLRRWANSGPVLYGAAAVFLAGTPVLMVVLTTQPLPAPPTMPPRPAPALPLLPSSCVQLAVIDSDPVTVVCVPAEQAG